MTVVMSNWLDAATAPQETLALEVTGATQFGLQVSTTGSPTVVEVLLQVSIDGSNWVSIAGIYDAAGGIAWAAERPTRYVRVKVAMLTGGTSPTVTASVIAA